MQVGILELLVSTTTGEWRTSVAATALRRQFYSIMPQAIAVWCRQLGHRVHYAVHYGQADPKTLLPNDLDIVFISTSTQNSALACALAKLYRRDKVMTVIGGPHAKCFPESCAHYFDIVVKECDRQLIEEILARRVDPPAVVTSGRVLKDIASVQERLPDIAATAFTRGRPSMTSIIPVLASLGCPYDCDFCTEWNNPYMAISADRLQADLRYISEQFPTVVVAFHDPNFAVRFDETMAAIESVPAGRRNRYVMERSLAILKGPRLPRLKDTNCALVAPGIESWIDYGGKSGSGSRQGRQKLERIVDHFHLLREYVPGLQANFIFGIDVDIGPEPFELTKEFMLRLPFVWPNLNIATPYGGTPMHERYARDGRILRAMPLSFYCAPYLVTTLRNYTPLEFYDRIIELHEARTSLAMLARRIAARAPILVRLSHVIRTFAMRIELVEMRKIRALLATDQTFRAFHEGHSPTLPEFYHRRFETRLGRYAELMPRTERHPTPGGEQLAAA
jgi:hypothetical protein